MSVLSRLRGTFRREKLDSDLDEELRAHLEMRVADNIAAGMTPEDARYDAQKRFGNSTLVKEDARNTDIIGWLDTVGGVAAAPAAHVTARKVFLLFWKWPWRWCC